jgi:hypothetical protein
MIASKGHSRGILFPIIESLTQNTRKTLEWLVNIIKLKKLFKLNKFGLNF